MTQIIAVVTQEYALLASDRRLTWADGPHKGEVADDDSCKLVNLCGTTGIAYTGVAKMTGGVPTHEWIAKTLADAGCCDARCAEQTLVDRAPSGLPTTSPALRRLTFLFAGWGHFVDPPGLRPYCATVTNEYDATFKVSPEPLNSFNSFRKALREQEDLHCVVAGEHITSQRAENLTRNLRRLVDREIGPKEALRLLVDEVINTSKRCTRVGSKVLGFCIPKRGAQRFFESGKASMLAVQPNPETTAFSYFEEGYNELKQYGPTTVCGGVAVTDVETENDPSRDYQSSSVRILSLPKAPTPSKR